MVFKATRSQSTPKNMKPERKSAGVIRRIPNSPLLSPPAISTYQPNNNKATALYHQEELPFFPVVDAGKA